MKKVHESTETHEVIILVFTPQLFEINQAKTFAVKHFPSFCKFAIVFETFKTSALLNKGTEQRNSDSFILLDCFPLDEEDLN